MHNKTIGILFICSVVTNTISAMEQLEKIVVEDNAVNRLWRYARSLDEYEIEGKRAFDRACKPFFERAVANWREKNEEQYNLLLKNLMAKTKSKLNKITKKELKKLRLQAQIARWKAQEQRYRMQSEKLKKCNYVVIIQGFVMLAEAIVALIGFFKKKPIYLPTYSPGL